MPRWHTRSSRVASRVERGGVLPPPTRRGRRAMVGRGAARPAWPVRAAARHPLPCARGCRCRRRRRRSPPSLAATPRARRRRLPPRPPSPLPCRPPPWRPPRHWRLARVASATGASAPGRGRRRRRLGATPRRGCVDRCGHAGAGGGPPLLPRSLPSSRRDRHRVGAAVGAGRRGGGDGTTAARRGERPPPPATHLPWPRSQATEEEGAGADIRRAFWRAATAKAGRPAAVVPHWGAACCRHHHPCRVRPPRSAPPPRVGAAAAAAAPWRPRRRPPSAAVATVGGTAPTRRAELAARPASRRRGAGDSHRAAGGGGVGRPRVMRGRGGSAPTRAAL